MVVLAEHYKHSTIFDGGRWWSKIIVEVLPSARHYFQPRDISDSFTAISIADVTVGTDAK